MKQYTERTDQMGRTSSFPLAPQRIVSLVPSQTEFLFDLGLDKEIVGLTRFCIHPPQALKTKAIVGGTKNLDLAAIQALQPDLIIGNKEENEREQILALFKLYPVWMSDIAQLKDALLMITQVGDLVGRGEAAQAASQAIERDFQSLTNEIQNSPRPTTAYLIWRKPYMVAGGDTFIHAMLKSAGFDNVFSKHTRYPSITINELAEQKPHFILLSSEPYPFKEKHIEELTQELPDSNIRLVDGEMFSWYGTRLLKSSAYFKSLRKELGIA